MQAEQLFEVLIEGRPGDLILAYEAAEKMGDKFFQQLTLGMDMIDSGVSKAVREIVGDGLWDKACHWYGYGVKNGFGFEEMLGWVVLIFCYTESVYLNILVSI